MKDQFKEGPGHGKVMCGEFELLNTNDRSQIIPGMSVTMAFLIGMNMWKSLEHCPRPGCKAGKFTTLPDGGKIW